MIADNIEKKQQFPYVFPTQLMPIYITTVDKNNTFALNLSKYVGATRHHNNATTDLSTPKM